MRWKSPSILLSAEPIRSHWKPAVALVVIAAGVWLGRHDLSLYNMVEDMVEHSVLSGDSGRLIWAAAILVFLRSLPMAGFFWGALFFGSTLPGQRPPLADVLIPAVIAAAAFFLTGGAAFAPENYLAPLFVLAVALLLLPDLLRNYVLLPTLVLFQLFFAFLWLDQAPVMARFGFGLGDLPTAIRLAATFLRDTQVLNLVCISLFAAFFVSAVAVAALTALGHNRQQVIRESQHRQMQLERLRSEAAQTRVEKEMLTLVHDLKTPLTTIAGLSSLAGLQTEDVRIGEYTRRIAKSVDRVSAMISEILHGHVRKKADVDQLFDYVGAHFLVRTAANIRFTLDPDLPPLYINFIRMVRALINLIDNALLAITDRDDGEINVRALADGYGNVLLQVADNGKGIEPDQLVRIWDYGYTTGENSSGLGLAFVRQVVDASGGSIEFASRPKAGTTVTITLPGVKRNDQDPDH